MDKLEQQTATWSTKWFRGVSADHQLIPKKFRDQEVRHGFGKSYSDLDERVLCESIERKLGFFSNTKAEFIDILCLAQHLHFPTRLLDWTENLSTAFYFAIETKFCDPHIWVLNPGMLNSVHDVLFEDDPEDDDDEPSSVTYRDLVAEFLEEWVKSRPSVIYRSNADEVIDRGELALGGTNTSRHMKWPTSFYPEYVNRRLLIQQAGFTIHGTEKACLGKTISRLPTSARNQILVCFKFDADYLDRSRQKIRDLCPSPVQVYGDEYGLFSDILDSELWI